MSAIDAAVQPDRRPRVGESQSAAGAAGIDLRHFVDAVLGRPNSNTHFPLDDVESLIQQYVAQESSRSQEVARLKSVVTKLKTQAQKILARYRALQQEHKQCTAQPEAPEEKCLARKGTISAPVESPSRGVSADVRVGAPLSDEATSEMLSQFESLKAENKSLLSTIEALRAERVVLDCALKDANAQSAADTGKARKMQQQLQREVRRLQVKLGKLQEKEAGATRAEQVLADIRAKEAAEALADAKKAAAKAMMIAESTSSQLQELKEVREQLQSETAFLHRRVDQETEARRRVINQLRQSQKEAVEQRACVDELRDRATSANSEFAELGSKLQTCKKELQVALTERESEARLFQSERETLEAELRELRESHAAQWSAMAGSTASSPQTGNLGALDGDTPVPTKLADNFEMSQSRDELTALRRAYRVLQQQLDDFQTEAHVNQIAMARVLHEEHEQVQASAALRIAESEARHAELLDELREAQVETETQTAALKVELEDRDRVYFDLKLRLQSNVQESHVLRAQLSAARRQATQLESAVTESSDSSKSPAKDFVSGDEVPARPDASHSPSEDLHALSNLLRTAKAMLAESKIREQKAIESEAAHAQRAAECMRENQALECVVSDQSAELAAGRQQIAALAAKFAQQNVENSKKPTTRWNFW